MRIPDLDEYLTVPQFIDRYPNLGSAGAIWWQLRHRTTNGLSEARAVVELRSRPGQKRPRLLVHPARYADWIANHHKYFLRASRSAA